MQIILEIGILRFAANRFESRVNALLSKGYSLRKSEMTTGPLGLRLIFYAELNAPDAPAKKV